MEQNKVVFTFRTRRREPKMRSHLNCYGLTTDIRDKRLGQNAEQEGRAIVHLHQLWERQTNRVKGRQESKQQTNPERNRQDLKV